MYSIVIEHAFSDNSNLFPIAIVLRKRARYWAFRLISVLYFPLGNIFCSNKITLAFRWRPWVNNRDTTGLSVASAIKSSRMMMLLCRGLISHRSSDSSGTPLSKWMLFPRDFFNSSFQLNDYVSKFVRQNRFFHFVWDPRPTVRIYGES